MAARLREGRTRTTTEGARSAGLGATPAALLVAVAALPALLVAVAALPALLVAVTALPVVAAGFLGARPDIGASRARMGGGSQRNNERETSHFSHLEHATQFEQNVTLFLPPRGVVLLLRRNCRPRPSSRPARPRLARPYPLPRSRALPAEQSSDRHGEQRHEQRERRAGTAARRRDLAAARSGGRGPEQCRGGADACMLRHNGWMGTVDSELRTVGCTVRGAVHLLRALAPRRRSQHRRSGPRRSDRLHASAAAA